MLRFLMTALLLAAAGAAPERPANDLESRRKVFQALLTDQWEYALSHSPEFASILGDKRWNDKVSDLSQKAIEADQAMDRVFLARFEAIDATGFSEQEALTRTLQIRSYKESMAREKFHTWEMPVNQMNGIHLFAAQLPSSPCCPFPPSRITTITSPASLRYFPKTDGRHDRLHAPRAARHRRGRRSFCWRRWPDRRRESPRSGAGRTLRSRSRWRTFRLPSRKRIKRDDSRSGSRCHPQTSVLPAYKRPSPPSCASRYAPKGRTEVGLWSLPDGEARYTSA